MQAATLKKHSFLTWVTATLVGEQKAKLTLRENVCVCFLYFGKLQQFEVDIMRELIYILRYVFYIEFGYFLILCASNTIYRSMCSFVLVIFVRNPSRAHRYPDRVMYEVINGYSAPNCPSDYDFSACSHTSLCRIAARGQVFNSTVPNKSRNTFAHRSDLLSLYLLIKHTEERTQLNIKTYKYVI